MRKLVFLLCAVLVAGSAFGAGNHGVTVSWPASASQSGCTAPCSYTYLLFEGPGPGQENMTTPLATTGGLTVTDDGPTMNAYLGTTRCYVVKFQITQGTYTDTSASSGEACATFPQASVPPVGVTVTIH